MSTVKQLPARADVELQDTWDLSSLYEIESQWDADFEKAEGLLPRCADFRGKLGQDAATLAEYLTFDSELGRLFERLGTFAFLRTAEDQAAGGPQHRLAKYRNLATRYGEACSFVRPELLAIPAAQMDEMLGQPELQHFRLLLERILRYRPHTLSDKEEQLLAMQGEMAQVASQTFRQLHDADLKFGLVKDETGQEVELSNATLMMFLVSPDRDVRRTAFHQYYEQFQAHENSLAAMLAGSVHTDVYYARARKYETALSSALFDDRVPQDVYDSLIAAVRKNLPTVHRYYEVRRRTMQLPDIHFYDTYVPILSDLKVTHSWEAASDAVVESLAPLGDEYCETLRQGLTGRWCDRYPNQGKQSGAFSCGSFDGDPYILMNYKPDVLDDVFTLTHEAGHSMHSYYSASHQPFEYYDYSIFVAEVASTFNEQLLSHYMMERTEDDRHRAYLINREIDAIRGTIIRQTMFAEFEKIVHQMAESGEPLTVESFRSVYRELLGAYLGPQFTIDDQLSLECFRIPHFYRAFYVYKYATGLSAAIALSQRVLGGGEAELQAYLNFLKSGCSKFPLDLLRDAGVDMEQPEPVDTALARFETLVDQLDDLLPS